MARGNYPSAKQDQFMLRFPEGMRDKLKEEAARNNRSLNAEIVSRLSFSLGLDFWPEVPGHDRVDPDDQEYVATRYNQEILKAMLAQTDAIIERAVRKVLEEERKFSREDKPSSD